MASKIRQNYHEESEALINKQINMEFYASYVYLSMVSQIVSNIVKGVYICIRLPSTSTIARIQRMDIFLRAQNPEM